jgi:RimJ/RimL family protein N-acetyltransferase
MQNPVLIGENVYLRPLELDDAATVQPWVNDPQVTRFLLTFRPLGLHNERELIEKLTKGDDHFAFGIAKVADDRLIGVCGLDAIDWRSRHCGFGILIGPPGEWGQGFGREATRLALDYAFGTLNLHRVWLHVYDFNARGIRAYEAVGFVKEGVLRKALYREGEYHDVLTMAVLREEWEARRGGRA